MGHCPLSLFLNKGALLLGITDPVQKPSLSTFDLAIHIGIFKKSPRIFLLENKSFSLCLFTLFCKTFFVFISGGCCRHTGRVVDFI